jgi:hypothetical protein
VRLAEVRRGHGYRTGDYGETPPTSIAASAWRRIPAPRDQPWLLPGRPVPVVVRFAQRFVPTWSKKPFRSAGQINAAALAWLDHAPADQPAFILRQPEPHYCLAERPSTVGAAIFRTPRGDAKAPVHARIPAGLNENERTFFTAN